MLNLDFKDNIFAKNKKNIYISAISNTKINGIQHEYYRINRNHCRQHRDNSRWSKVHTLQSTTKNSMASRISFTTHQNTTKDVIENTTSNDGCLLYFKHSITRHVFRITS